MRNLILILILANLSYYFWVSWVAVPTVDNGEIIRVESELVPVAVLVEPTVAAVRSEDCYLLGFFETEEVARNFVSATAGLDDAVVEPGTRAVFVGHWVQIGGLTRAEANRQLQILKSGGLTETYMVGDDVEGYALSLGLFSELAGAESVKSQADKLSVTSVVVNRTRQDPTFVLRFAAVDRSAFDPLLAANSDLVVSECTVISDEN